MFANGVLSRILGIRFNFPGGMRPRLGWVDASGTCYLAQTRHSSDNCPSAPTTFLLRNHPGPKFEPNQKPIIGQERTNILGEYYARKHWLVLGLDIWGAQ